MTTADLKVSILFAHVYFYITPIRRDDLAEKKTSINKYAENNSKNLYYCLFPLRGHRILLYAKYIVYVLYLYKFAQSHVTQLHSARVCVSLCVYTLPMFCVYSHLLFFFFKRFVCCLLLLNLMCTRTKSKHITS